MAPQAAPLADFSLSDQQQQPVMTRGGDVVVTAGAGTGKTRTLVARFLSLVLEGVSLREVVAVTFTRKAARELRNRVRAELTRLLDDEDPHADPARTQRLREELNNLDAARIGTIHNLCAEILRTHPAEAGIDPRFRILEEAEVALLQDDAITTALGWAADAPETIPLFAALGEGALRDALRFMLQKGIRPAAIDPDPADLRRRWEDFLQQLRQAALDTLLADPGWRDGLDDLRALRPLTDDDLLAGQVVALQRALQQAAPLPPLAKIPLLNALQDIDLRGGRQAAWPGGKEEVRAVKDTLRTLRDLWRGAAPALLRSLNDADALLLTLLPPLNQVGAVAWRHYAQQKQAGAGLDFDDLEEQALRLLEESAAARSYWQRQIGALLVDEFQDTNDRQRRLVRALCAQPGKLFIVGDAKQSIYRFRGADVTVFRAEQARIAAAGGLVGRLSTSYRSHAALVSGVNRLMGPILGPAGPDRAPWEAPFEALDPARSDPAAGVEVPFIRFQLAFGSKKEGGLTRAAAALASSLPALTAGGRLGYGDVAVLCRASSSFAAYEDALDAAAIPYMTVAGRGFYDRPEVRDLLNALQAVADPTDDLALAGLLRSPACGLSDGALFTLVAARPEGSSLWDALRDQGASLADGDAARAAAAARLIADLQQLAGRTAVAQVLQAFLDRTAYAAALVSAGLGRALRNVDKLLTSALNSDLVSVADFLAYTAGVRTTVGREGEARAVAEGAVQIMTIHAAKGLEFPVVVLGDAGKVGRRNRVGIIHDARSGLLLDLATDASAAPAIFAAALDQNEREEAAEARRLLYVAATRAEELLVINGNVSLNKNGLLTSGWLSDLAAVGGLADLDMAGIDPEGDAAHARLLQLDGTALGVTFYEGSWAPPAAAGAASQPPLAVAAGRPTPLLVAPLSSTTEVRDERRRVWQVLPTVEEKDPPGWLIGKLIHEAAEAWRFPEPGFDAWVAARARYYGVSDAVRLPLLTARVRLLLLRLRESPLFHLIEGARRRFHEVPYVLPEEEVTGVIDLLLEDVTGRWIIIDFKSEPRIGARFPRDEHVTQIRRYGAAASRLLGTVPALWLCYLDDDGRVEIRKVDAGKASAR